MQNRTSHNSHGGGRRPSRGGNSFRGRRSASSFRGNSGRRPYSSRGGGGHSRGRGRGPAGERIDISRFIHKAEPIEAVAPYVAKHKFVDFEIADSIKRGVIAKGYDTPTPIQDQTIPYILAGKDLIGLANTGTGKTAAFLIPLIDKVFKNKNEQVLITAPTRELAIQIEQELKEFARGMGIFSVCLVGGAPIGRQIRELRRHQDFVIGTPGRIKDLINRKYLKLSTFKTIVLDEADRMLDMGFIGDIRFMLEEMPKEHHTLFFSATLSREIEKLVSEFLKDPVRVSVKTGDTAKSVDQDIVKIGGGEKINILTDLLKTDGFDKVLIFGKTKRGVEKLSHVLRGYGVKSESIHGDKNQSQRQRALKRFNDNLVQALIATDVAARGLDISGVSHVINYDLPQTYEDYVHRIGRTGRAGKPGKALTFVG